MEPNAKIYVADTITLDTTKQDVTPSKLQDVGSCGLSWRLTTSLVEGLRLAHSDYLNHLNQQARA